MVILWVAFSCEEAVPEEKLASLEPPNKQDYEEQVKYLSDLIEKHPNLDKLYFQRALANIKAGRLRAARKDLEDAILINRSEPKYHYYRAIVENRFNRIDEALNSALTAQAAGFNHPDLTGLLGELYFKNGNYSLAKKYLLECENSGYHSDSSTLYYLGYIFLYEMDTIQARNRLERLLKEYPYSSRGRPELMRLYMKEAQSRRALNIYYEAEKLKTLNASIVCSAAKAYERIQKPDSALILYSKAFQMDTTQWEAALALKDQKLKEKNLRAAVRYYENALLHNPRIEKGFWELGFIYEYYFFDFDKAEKCYRKGLQYNPDSKKLKESVSRIEAKKLKGRNYFINPPKNIKKDTLQIGR